MTSAKTLFIVFLLISLYCLAFILTDDQSYGCASSMLVAYFVEFVSLLIVVISGIVWLVTYILKRRN